MKKLTSLLVLGVLMASFSLTAPAKLEAAPTTVAICYYGVTQYVSPALAARYVRLGATYGACQ